MNRRDDDRYGDFERRDNNFDRMYDARQYRDDGYSDYNRPNYRDNGMRRDESRDMRRYDRNYDDMRRDERREEPKKRSFFGRSPRKRDRDENIGARPAISNQCVVMIPKSFEDIEGIIDNLKMGRALIADLSKLNGESVQRVMDYINGAIYAIDGSIQRVNPAVFLLTPTGMGISVPIDYIKDKWERNKKK